MIGRGNLRHLRCHSVFTMTVGVPPAFVCASHGSRVRDAPGCVGPSDLWPIISCIVAIYLRGNESAVVFDTKDADYENY